MRGVLGVFLHQQGGLAFWASGSSERFHVVMTRFREVLRVRSRSHLQKQWGKHFPVKIKFDFQKDFETISEGGRNF